MNQTQCNELRDSLFAGRFSQTTDEDPFRYIAVLPAGYDGSSAAAVHYAYAQPSWERAKESMHPETFLLALIASSKYASEPFELKHHDYLREGWSAPWDLTAKASHNDFPTLVLLEEPGGAVTGVLMRDPHCGRVVERIAMASAERYEAAALIEALRDIRKGEKYHSWYKDSNIDAASLAEAIAHTPETLPGQKALLVYRDAEWLHGHWSNPAKVSYSQELRLSSVADFHGSRVSAAKRATRPGLDIARASQTIPGHAPTLKCALTKFGPKGLTAYAGDFERMPAIELLCSWWNERAPEEMREAAIFRTYIWNPFDAVFLPGDPEEPALSASQLAREGAFALFEELGLPAVAIQFCRGRAYNQISKTGGTQTYLANGAEFMDISLDIEQVDESYCAAVGLQTVRSRWV